NPRHTPPLPGFWKDWQTPAGRLILTSILLTFGNAFGGNYTIFVKSRTAISI
ncbi:hypothetical protein BO82DRAFT_349251, partial [Aspergillus uvarum CBS 121591]